MHTTEKQISTICEMLKSGPQRYADLMLVTGLSKQTVFQLVKQMRDAKLVRIGGYAKDVRGRLFVPMFVWGGGADEPRPGQTRTGADRMRDLRARRAAEGVAK